ncbi:MAG: helix-turn-helix domain-containing protein [Natrialbaceae archaeon]|nr:helix-turn-helix domain-containing protein [Natrialbaceae archaeon]
MVRDGSAPAQSTEIEPVCSALDDEDCRTIIRTLEEPMTAAELDGRCDIPQSTLYRKLEVLTEASLLEESTEIRQDGHHASRYAVSFQEIRIAVDTDREFTVAIERPPRTADERLAHLWSEVRRET